MRRRAALGLVAAATTAVTAPRARAEDCAGEAAALRAHLADEAHRARRWGLAWGIGLGAVAGGQLALGLDPTGSFGHDLELSFKVGAAKAALGSAFRLVLPLRVEVPPAASDACADLAALRDAARITARRERNLFWLGHIGALAVNLGGSVVIGLGARWVTAAESFALGYPVGLLMNYTMPRGTWHAVRDWPVAVTFTPRPGGGVLAISGAL